MKQGSNPGLVKAMLMFALSGILTPAFAHVSASHGVNGFEAGFLHPLMGMDHLLAILAVGIWAAQQRGRALWILPLTFPLTMLLGAWLDMQGIQIEGVEEGIAVSVLILGLLIAAAIKLPLFISVGLISVFALAHGYVHAREMAAGVSAIWFIAGLVLSTILLHICGLLAALTAKRFLTEKLNRVAGTGIAMTGLFFVSKLI
ncbi:HupE/UreJ family protein [Undibacterium sp. JH2W]|uniref:HupE/UreJ family protein n=1 Tax=Undibacterium sp. JH2W TaxID=3413037 RepID=UPI003BF22723